MYARTLLVAEVHLADILAGSCTWLHLVDGPRGAMIKQAGCGLVKDELIREASLCLTAGMEGKLGCDVVFCVELKKRSRCIEDDGGQHQTVVGPCLLGFTYLIGVRIHTK